MGSEIELKLTIDPIDVAPLRHRLMSMTAKRRHDPYRRLVSTYFDTKSFSLAQKSLSLRIRKIGHRRIQTIKRAPSNGGSLITRSEWENAIQGDRPNLRLINDQALRSLIGKYRVKERLGAIFVTDVTRETWLLRLDGSEVECALDRGRIVAPERHVPICELELELKAGSHRPLFSLARKLNKAARLHVETQSKAARGYALVTEAPSAPPRPKFAELDEAMTAQSAFAAIAYACTGHVLSCAGYARGNEDPEAIHELRVAIRRLRAAFSVFREVTGEKPAAIARKLRALQLELGAAREWDVLIQESIGTMPKRLRAQKSFIELIKAAEAKQTKEHKRARDALDDPQCTDLLLELTWWVDRRFGTNDQLAPPEKTPCKRIADFAAQLIKARDRKVRKLGKKIGKLDAAHLHELRIRIKKLRYAVEFFRDLWRGARVKKYLSTLKHLQNSLGSAHDAMVSSRLIMDLAASQEHKDKFMESRLADWAAACFESELKNTDHLLQKLLRFKSLARMQG